MHLREWFSSGNPCKQFDTNKSLYEGLQRLESSAILCLQLKAMPTIKKLVANNGLEAAAADEIFDNSTMILLQKISDGSYQFLGHAPTTYFIEIAKRQALMATRSLKKATEPLDKLPDAPDPDHEALLRRNEAADTVRLFLDKLGKPCNDVIRLHHIDGYSDEEVVSQRLTTYSTTNSLKMKRSDCMKKLVEIAIEWKKSTNI